MRISIEQLKTFTKRFLRTLADNKITETKKLHDEVGECFFVVNSDDYLMSEYRPTPDGRELVVGYCLRMAKCCILSFRIGYDNKYFVMQAKCCVSIPEYNSFGFDKDLNIKQTKRIDYFTDLSIIKGELEKILEM